MILTAESKRNCHHGCQLRITPFGDATPSKEALLSAFFSDMTSFSTVIVCRTPTAPIGFCWGRLSPGTEPEIEFLIPEVVGVFFYGTGLATAVGC